jgi:hypothetical protein
LDNIHNNLNVIYKDSSVALLDKFFFTFSLFQYTWYMRLA